MEIPKILQAKRDGSFYDYIEEIIDVDPIYGNMSDSELNSVETEVDMMFNAQVELDEVY